MEFSALSVKQNFALKTWLLVCVLQACVVPPYAPASEKLGQNLDWPLERVVETMALQESDNHALLHRQVFSASDGENRLAIAQQGLVIVLGYSGSRIVLSPHVPSGLLQGPA